jgi:deazaflavin-dependent oxidoreductase (nitroreductase family)
MIDLDQPTDPPPGWQRDHTRGYLDTDGADGYVWNGVPTLLLTTLGRRSGMARRTPLIFGRDGDRYLVVASAGGQPGHPYWYRNLAEEPRVRVQVQGELFDAQARTATAAEKPELWKIMTGIWPAYDDYQKRTDREIPLVVLERVDGHGPSAG